MDSAKGTLSTGSFMNIPTDLVAIRPRPSGPSPTQQPGKVTPGAAVSSAASMFSDWRERRVRNTYDGLAI